MQDGIETGGRAERSERRDARENRLLLIDVAKRLFAEQGVAATTMKQIAEAAGVGKGTLYRRFPDKGELCRVLIREDVAAFQDRVGAQLADAQHVPSALARLDILITERIRLADIHLPLLEAIEEAASGAQEQGRRFRGPFTAWTHAQVVRLLREAMEQGEVASLDEAFIADTILGAMSPALLTYQRHECGYSVERIIAGMRCLFIEGLRQKQCLT